MLVVPLDSEAFLIYKCENKNLFSSDFFLPNLTDTKDQILGGGGNISSHVALL